MLQCKKQNLGASRISNNGNLFRQVAVLQRRSDNSHLQLWWLDNIVELGLIDSDVIFLMVGPSWLS